MKKHILVVDDEPAIRYPIIFMLSKTGYKVSEARDGLEALNLILHAEDQGDPFDLLLTDIRMPRMSGMELIHELKWNEINLPVIAISGMPDEELVQKLLNIGCSGYIMKPFDIQDLIRQVEQVLHGRAKTGRSYNSQAF